MSYETDLDLIRRAMEGDIGEPQTPKEIAEHKVEMAVRDAWLATAELYKLRLDPIAAPFVSKAEGDLWSIKTRVDLLLSEIKAEAEAAPKLRVVSNG